MNISLKRNLSRSGWAVRGLLAVAILGLLVIQGCATSAQYTGGGQEDTGPTGANGSELAPAPEIGHPAPDFTLNDIEGNPFRLSDLRGKVVFINFWATWCPPCRAEMPEIEAVYQEYKDKDVVVVGVDILVSEILKGYDENDVRRFVQQGGYSWTFVLDTTGEVTNSYGIIYIPTSFFLDKEGIIRAVTIGPMTKRAMEAKLATAMR